MSKKPYALRTTRPLEESVLALGRNLLTIHGLSDWKIEWADVVSGDNAGQCWQIPKVITISREKLLDTEFRNIIETLLHEIAHALVAPNDKHDQAWHDVLTSIGGTGLWVTTTGKVRVQKIDQPVQNLDAHPFDS